MSNQSLNLFDDAVVGMLMIGSVPNTLPTLPQGTLTKLSG